MYLLVYFPLELDSVRLKHICCGIAGPVVAFNSFSQSESETSRNYQEAKNYFENQELFWECYRSLSHKRLAGVTLKWRPTICERTVATTDPKVAHTVQMRDMSCRCKEASLGKKMLHPPLHLRVKKKGWKRALGQDQEIGKKNRKQRTNPSLCLTLTDHIRVLCSSPKFWNSWHKGRECFQMLMSVSISCCLVWARLKN